jgi:hypothetical protein
MKKIFMLLTVLMITLSVSGCDAADLASENISKGADNFEILRKVIFYNVITGEYMHVIEGYCSIEADTLDNQLEVTCKTGPQSYIKDYLGISDNTSYMVLQVEGANVSTYHYRVILRPQTLLPSIEIDIR